MALTATIGSSSADSYVTLAEAATYHANRGNTAWDAADSEAQEWAARKATDYLDSHYAWRGGRVASTQALDWPRAGVTVDGYVVATTVLPAALKAACFELALKALSAELLTDADAQYVESVTVGPITRKLSARGNGGQKRYSAVDALLRDLVRGGNNSIEVVRG
jgi:hypothetical protein